MKYLLPILALYVVFLQFLSSAYAVPVSRSLVHDAAVMDYADPNPPPRLTPVHPAPIVDPPPPQSGETVMDYADPNPPPTLVPVHPAPIVDPPPPQSGKNSEGVVIMDYSDPNPPPGKTPIHPGPIVDPPPHQGPPPQRD